MQKLAKCVAVAVIAIAVLVPAAAWWAQGSNRHKLVEWVVGPSEQRTETAGIRTEAESVQSSDVAAVLNAWMWKLKVDVPPDGGWKHAWLVVKKKGETAEVFHGGSLYPPNGEPRPWNCLVAITPVPFGESVMSCDKVAILLNGMHGRVIDNPFKVSSGMGMQTAKPKFVGNQAVLAIVQQSPNSGIGADLESEEGLKRISEYDAVLMLVLTESLNSPPITVKKKK